MQYMFLIYFDPAKAEETIPPAPGQFTDWYEYTKALQAAGVHRSGEPLEASYNATTLRLKDGQRVLTDGPFIETKEELVGYYVIEAPNLDSALDWAAKMPDVGRGAVEVRPVMVFEPVP